MDVDDLKEFEYDAQLLGFTVNEFITAIRLTVADEVTHFTEVMIASLMKKKYSSDNPEIEQVKNLTKSLIDQYMYASQKPLKNLENQLRELMHIPPHVLLPNDAVQRTQYTVEEEWEVDDQINQLLARIKRTKAFNVELRHELKFLQSVLPLVNNQVNGMELLVTEKKENVEVLKSLEPYIEEIVNNNLQLLNINKG